MRLYDCATSIRSKNAGPFTLTIDLVLPDVETYRRVAGSEAVSPARVAALYRVPEGSVRVVPFERVLTVKVSMPRRGSSSGTPGDQDVYGCQQHFPLGDVEI